MNRNTQYGFDWGPLCVERAFHNDRYHTLLITTRHWDIQLSVSPTGHVLVDSMLIRLTPNE